MISPRNLARSVRLQADFGAVLALLDEHLKGTERTLTGQVTPQQASGAT
jgi:hypothetical protein